MFYFRCHADGNADNIWFCNLCSTLLCKSQVAEHSVCDQVKKISSEHIQFPTKVSIQISKFKEACLLTLSLWNFVNKIYE